MFYPEFIDLSVALLLGACLGAERSYAGKTAGMRTYGLVSMGSCLFILISRFAAISSGEVNLDQMRMAAGVIMGIGFLGGGVIVFKDSKVSGLTTAAGLWVAAGIGMAVGYGYASLATFATIATLIVFTFFWMIEHVIFRMENRKNKNDR